MCVSIMLMTSRKYSHKFRSSNVIDLGANRKPSPYVTSYQSSIVTLAVSATVFEIFTVKDRKLLILLTCPSVPSLTPPSGGTPIDINVIYTQRESAFNGLQFRRWHYRSIFIRLAVVVSQSREIAQNSDKIWPYSSSRSSKVIDVGVNRKPY